MSEQKVWQHLILYSSFLLFPCETLTVFVFFSRDLLRGYYKEGIKIWPAFKPSHEALPLK